MELKTMGIIGNTLYVEPFYAGDYYHELTLSSWELVDFKEQGIPVYDSIDYIDCQCYNMEVEEYRRYVDEANARARESRAREVKQASNDNGLPF